MKQKKMLTLTFSQLKQIYGQEIPEIVEIADKSSTVEDFKAGILRLLETCRIENEAAEEAREQIRLLLHYDGQNVHELSTGQDMSVQTIRLLYEFLTGTLENMEMPTDLFIEIYQIYRTYTKKENNSQTSENEYAVLQIFKYLYLLSVVFIVFS